MFTTTITNLSNIEHIFPFISYCFCFALSFNLNQRVTFAHFFPFVVVFSYIFKNGRQSYTKLIFRVSFTLRNPAFRFLTEINQFPHLFFYDRKNCVPHFHFSSVVLNIRSIKLCSELLYIFLFLGKYYKNGNCFIWINL